MLNILDHVESGGNLRIINDGMGGGVLPFGGSGTTILGVLQILKTETVISDFRVRGNYETYYRPNTLSYILIHQP